MSWTQTDGNKEMFENDYLMRMILKLVEAMRRSLEKRYGSFAEEQEEIERAIGDAVDMDPQLLLSLTPESVVSMLQLGSFDAKLGAYVVRALFYEADLFEEQGRFGSADLRRAQARAISEAYGVDADIESATPESLEEFFAYQEALDTLGMQGIQGIQDMQDNPF